MITGVISLGRYKKEPSPPKKEGGEEEVQR